MSRKKGWPYYWPSGRRVSPETRKKFQAELKKVKSRSRYKARKGFEGSVNMARRKSRVRYVTRKARKSRRYSGTKFSIQKLAIPIGAATVVEPIVDSYANMLPIPAFAGVQSDDIAKIAIGWYLGKKGGIMGDTAKMLGIFGLRNVIAGLVGGGLLGQTTTTPSWG